MPQRPPKPCAQPGCPVLIRNGAARCERHRIRRESAHRRGYGATWQRIRAAHLRRHPVCVECALKSGTTAAELEALLRRIRSGDVADLDPDAIVDAMETAERCAANEVDHVVPHRGDRVLLLDRGNLQSMCRPHHSAKTGRGG
jgi:5-methylcytosine-specific restriction enzyme A